MRPRRRMHPCGIFISQNHRIFIKEDRMILACHNIEKAFGEEVIVSGVSFHIEDHEKAALVGPNGAGKTTLLKMIVGEIQADGGNVVLTRGKTMGIWHSIRI